MIVCPNCKRKVKELQFIRVEWKKKGKHINMCPYCFKEYMRGQIKNVELDPRVLLQIKHVLGLDEADVLDYLTKWNKNQFETF